jgi:hypothetical protein
MMGSLVLELQKESLDENVPLKSLARKAMLISQKLGLDDSWAQCELYGFTEKEPPLYRVVNGQIVAEVPGRGYLPIDLPENLSTKMDSFTLRQPIAELEVISGYKNNFAFIPLPSGLQGNLRDIFCNQYMYYFRIPLSQIVSLLDTIRSQILSFTLRLEKEGVLGEGMSFNNTEKDKVQQMVNLTVNGHFQGILGDVQNSNVTQSFSNGIQVDLNALCEILRQSKVSDTDIDALKIAYEVDGDVVTIPDQYGPEVKSWFNKMMAKAIDGTWAISIGTAANLLATGLNKLYLGA